MIEEKPSSRGDSSPRVDYMETKNEDLRIRRTRKLLCDALFSLIMELPFEEILVTDICEKAMVHRTTFYKHFSDKNKLLEYGLNELNDIFQESNVVIHSGENLKDYYMGLLRQLLIYMKTNRAIYLPRLIQSGNLTVMTTLHQALCHIILSKLEEECSNSHLFSIPIEVIAEFYTGACISVTRWWLENDMPLSIDALMKDFDLLTLSKIPTTQKENNN